MSEQDIQMIARQASGEYMMRHIAGIMELVQEKRIRNKEDALDEKTLAMIEAQVKATAEGLTHSNAGVPI